MARLCSLLLVLLFLHVFSACAQSTLFKSDVTLTYYWISFEDEHTGVKNTQLKTCSGVTLTTVTYSFAVAVRMEGTGVLEDGRLINLGACGCAGGFSCFMELDPDQFPFGVGSNNNPLRLYTSVAANDITYGTVLYVPEFDGVALPGTDGKIHNGCVLVEDVGWSFGGNQIDWFVAREGHYQILDGGIVPEQVTLYREDCIVQDYTTGTTIPPESSDPVIPVESSPEVISEPLGSPYKSDVTLTYYWISFEDEHTGVKNTQLKTCSGVTLATVAYSFAVAVRMEGTGVLEDGRLINLGGCSCAGGFSCFMELDADQFPFGVGSNDNPLRLYTSVAANDITYGTILYVPEFEGVALPGTDGKIHNGCVVVEDVGWSFGGNQIDWFVAREGHYQILDGGIVPEQVTLYREDCIVQDYTTGIIIPPESSDAVIPVESSPEVVSEPLEISSLPDAGSSEPVISDTSCIHTDELDCTGLRNGYYCLTDNSFAWCYELVCPCGFTTVNPCTWPNTQLSPCEGSTGDFMSPYGGTRVCSAVAASSDGGIPQTSIFGSTELGIMNPNEHLSLVMRFTRSGWQQQLHELILQPFYDDESLYSPSPSTYGCSFHPPAKYDSNPSQLWIGRPIGTTTISLTPGVTLRLPDRFIAMFLGYALDHYGLNPSMLLALGAKETFFSVLFIENDDSYFIVDDLFDHYDCYDVNREGLFRDNNLDGPYQVENGAMSSDVSVMPQRFWLGEENVAKEDREPLYLTDNELMVISGFRDYHDTWTLHSGRATILTCLDFHYRHNMLLNARDIHLKEAIDRRVSREAKDEIEFAAAMYTYNRGLFDMNLREMLDNCGPTDDPSLDCGLDGFGQHTTNIRDACKLLDFVSNTEVYDYLLQWSDVEYFLNTLEWSYPYASVDNLHDYINWSAIWSDSREAFDILELHRQTSHGSQDQGISLRYDWRALFSVVRMHLPSRESFVGDTLYYSFQVWGGPTGEFPGIFLDPDDYPLESCSVAGGKKDLCGAFSGSSIVDSCPNDPAKTEPGICGCGVSDTDSDEDGAPDCIDECPLDSQKILQGECGCGVPEGSCNPHSSVPSPVVDSSSIHEQVSSPSDVIEGSSGLSCEEIETQCLTDFVQCALLISGMSDICQCVQNWVSCLSEADACPDIFPREAQELLACADCGIFAVGDSDVNANEAADAMFQAISLTFFVFMILSF